jgi:sugar lactone lactonase YvrE
MHPFKFRAASGICAAAMLLSGAAFAKNSDIYAKTRVFVPDQGNNRVLIYNDPTTSAHADVVLGQSSFSTATPGTSATTMSGPSAYAVDENGILYVSDTGNCRVLQFRPPFTDGQAANLVIGAPDANTGCGYTPNASSFSGNDGLVIDDSGNLWVADTGNNRVLHFKKPFKTGEAADFVLGQPDFATTACVTPPTAGSMCAPNGVTSDSDEILWVTDTSNNRVLGFKAPKKKMNANFELGHPAATAFTSNTANDGGISARTFNAPTGIGFDSKDHMWVADTQNSRVLMFKPDFRNGNAASLVLGQPDFMQAFSNQNGTPTAATFSMPRGIAIPRNNIVYVGDTGNNRTLQFVSPYTNDMNASVVLGQADFTHYQPNQGGVDPSDESESMPFNVAGPSLIALAVLGGLGGGRQWLVRMRRRA